MSGRVIAIGDIHGCADALDGLIDWIAPSADDTLVVLGDCIDRGPNSRGVIEQLLTLADHCEVVPILGNHEEMLLAAVDRPATLPAWLECGGRETLESYEVERMSELPHDHVLYLRTWVDYFETSNHFFAHGNYDPQVPLDEQEWGYQRWASLHTQLPDRHHTGKTAVVGHTSQKTGEVLSAEYLVCIDTFCCGGKWLTAFDVTHDRFFQVAPNGRRRAAR